VPPLAYCRGLRINRLTDSFFSLLPSPSPPAHHGFAVNFSTFSPGTPIGHVRYEFFFLPPSPSPPTFHFLVCRSPGDGYPESSQRFSFGLVIHRILTVQIVPFTGWPLSAWDFFCTTPPWSLEDHTNAGINGLLVLHVFPSFFLGLRAPVSTLTEVFMDITYHFFLEPYELAYGDLTPPLSPRARGLRRAAYAPPPQAKNIGPHNGFPHFSVGCFFPYLWQDPSPTVRVGP